MTARTQHPATRAIWVRAIRVRMAGVARALGGAPAVLAGSVAGLVLLAGCASAAPSPTPAPSTSVDVRTVTVTPAAPTLPAVGTVAPLSPSAPVPAGQTEGACKYVDSTTVEDIVGSHVYRTTTSADGCWFFFYAPPFSAIADVRIQHYPSAADATDAMTRIAARGTQVMSQPDIIPGVDGALYRTRFFGPDDGRDWACVFASGSTVVEVRTQRTDTSLPALDLAAAVAHAL